MWEGQSIGGGVVPGQAVLDCIIKQVEQALVSNPVSSIPLHSLVSSCLEFCSDAA